MDMKQLTISGLMDEYQDHEFFPDEGTAVDSQAVKARVLSQITPAKKRRIPPWKAALLAAALTVVCVLSVAAAVGGPVVRYISGAVYENGVFDGLNAVSPAVIEDGRIWFIGGGQRTDITDLIDANTPYIYTHTDPETTATTYTVVGGALDDLGWFEYALFYQTNDCSEAGYLGENYYTQYVTIDGATYSMDELTPEQETYLHGLGSWTVDMVYRPWALSAAHQLGIEHWD